MTDSISRQAAIEDIRRRYPFRIWDTEDIAVWINGLPSARPDNQINLCDSCDYSYPDCPSKNDDVIFGNGIGNDNICACNKYKPSAQSERGCEECVFKPFKQFQPKRKKGKWIKKNQ